jgi:spermidine/putrescine transport system permease protein
MSRLPRLDPLTIYGVLFIAFLYGPVLTIPLFAFNDGLFAIFPLRGFTLKHFGAMLHNDGLLRALQNSLLVGLIVAVISTGLGMLAAMAATRYRLPGQSVAMSGIMAPMVIPSIVLGIGLLVIARRVLDLELSLWTIGAGHVLVCLPYSLLVLTARLEGFDRSLEEASGDLGESPWMTFWRVTFPLALPGLISSLLTTFTTSFDEFVLAFFLSGTQTTLPVFMFSQLRFPQYLPSMLALGTSILIASSLLVVVAEIVRRRGIDPDKG